MKSQKYSFINELPKEFRELGQIRRSSLKLVQENCLNCLKTKSDASEVAIGPDEPKSKQFDKNVKCEALFDKVYKCPKELKCQKCVNSSLELKAVEPSPQNARKGSSIGMRFWLINSSPASTPAASPVAAA